MRSVIGPDRLDALLAPRKTQQQTSAGQDGATEPAAAVWTVSKPLDEGPASPVWARKRAYGAVRDAAILVQAGWMFLAEVAPTPEREMVAAAIRAEREARILVFEGKTMIGEVMDKREKQPVAPRSRSGSGRVKKQKVKEEERMDEDRWPV
jgi:hypothetical protein